MWTREILVFPQGYFRETQSSICGNVYRVVIRNSLIIDNDSIDLVRNKLIVNSIGRTMTHWCTLKIIVHKFTT